MSSYPDLPLQKSDSGTKSGERTSGRCLYRGSGGKLLQGHRDRGRSPSSRSSQGWESMSEKEADMEGRSVVWGCEGRPGTPVDERNDSSHFTPSLTVEGTSIRRQMVNHEAWVIRRYPFPQSYGGNNQFPLWGELELGYGRRGMLGAGSIDTKHTAASLLCTQGAWRGRSWSSMRKGPPKMTPENSQSLSSDLESSDGLSKAQVRGAVSLKDESQSKASEVPEGEDPSKHPNAPGREGLHLMPASQLLTASQDITSGREKQASGTLEASFPKKKPSAALGKDGKKLSYAGVVASTPGPRAPSPTVALRGHHKSSPRKKGANEKKPTWDTSKLIVGRTFPPWGQRLKSAPVEPATFPPISGVALLGRVSKCSVLPAGPRQYKKSTGKKTKESQLAVREDEEPTREPDLQTQLPAPKAKQPVACAYPAEFSSGDPNPRTPQVPGNLQRMITGHRGIRPRAPVPSGDQEPPLRPPVRVQEEELQGPGPMGCPQCQVLQKEIEDLREQLEVIRTITKEFHTL